MKNELKPCPVCGRTLLEIDDMVYGHENLLIKCKFCDMEYKIPHSDGGGFSVWNCMERREMDETGAFINKTRQAAKSGNTVCACVIAGDSEKQPVEEKQARLFRSDTQLAIQPAILFKKLHPDAIIPEYRHDGDSGFDLHCLREATINPGECKLVPTGLAMALPKGFELQVRMRSGAGLKTPLIITNAPGTVDSGYRGDIGLILRNIGDAPYTLKKGERVAQGIVAPVCRAEIIETHNLPESDRGENGYGSTGKD